MTRLKAVKDTRRKRRLPRLPSAILLDDTISEILREDINGLTPKFEPTMDDWQHMGADGFSLDAADQEEICKLVSSYFQSQPFEKSAPFVADKKNGWTRSKGAAEGFHQALLSGEELEEIERNAAFEASARIELHLEKMHCVLSRMDDFKNATEGFLTAAVVVEHD